MITACDTLDAIPPNGTSMVGNKSPTSSSAFASSGTLQRQRANDHHHHVDVGDDCNIVDESVHLACDSSSLMQSSGKKGENYREKKDKKIKKDKQKKKKRQRSEELDSNCGNDRHDDGDGNNRDDDDSSKRGKKKKKEEKRKKRKMENRDESIGDECDDAHNPMQQLQPHPQLNSQQQQQKIKSHKPVHATKSHYFPFEYEHILAPMVGASELAFRLLCRKYGATLCYTPMMSAKQFSEEADRIIKSNASSITTNVSYVTTTANLIANSNICEFQTIPQDRPLVVHFSANNPIHFASAAKHVEHLCDAIDLNLGCPQRTAYLGHFGSYLLDECDRQLILDIVKAGATAVSIPIFVKIRLLDKVEDTIRLCQELRDAGASLIAIHARYRASWERTGAGARDGPAMLDQVASIKRSMPDFPIIANGNVITYKDVVANRKLTGADGIMSAEGMLDNPALYLPRLGNKNNDDDDDDDAAGNDINVQVPVYSPLRENVVIYTSTGDTSTEKAKRKLQKKLREVEAIEKKVKELGMASINDDQRQKLEAKSKIQAEINLIENTNRSKPLASDALTDVATQHRITSVKLTDLMKAGENKLVLAREYLSLVQLYPTKIRSVTFHVRRMCKEVLEQYQLMEECIASTSVNEVESVLTKCERYIQHPNTFHYDREKAEREKEALAAKRREEGKRKAYEERMTRKAKREGLSDLGYYLRIGAEVPTVEIITELKSVSKEERLAVWKKDHSQHCIAFHFDDGGCKRDRACAFMHVEARGGEEFIAGDEVAG